MRLEVRHSLPFAQSHLLNARLPPVRLHDAGQRISSRLACLEEMRDISLSFIAGVGRSSWTPS